MRPEGFRKVYTERGVEGALFVLAEALESLARRVDAQNAVEDKLRGEAPVGDEPPPDAQLIASPMERLGGQPPPQPQAESQPAASRYRDAATAQAEGVRNG